jgi:hypothetical protein
MEQPVAHGVQVASGQNTQTNNFGSENANYVTIFHPLSGMVAGTPTVQILLQTTR